MYFVHPQIKLNKNNLKRVFFGFLKPTNLDNLRKKLTVYFPDKEIVFTDMGRSAFKIIIEVFKLKNSQIILPAYICDIFYPILKHYNIEPIFLDIEPLTFHIDLEEIERKITPKTKAILLCHTYGLPVDLKKIEKLKKNYKELLIIEDCAHAFGANNIGNLGDVAFFSIYKQFPTFRGGMLVSPKKWKAQIAKTSFSLRDFISFLNSLSLFAFLFKTFGENIALKWQRKEKMQASSGINHISLNFFSCFLDDFEKSLEKRKDLALFFQKELQQLGFWTQESKNNVFCYLSALIPQKMEDKRNELVKKLRKENIFCTRIWHNKENSTIIFNPRARKKYRINLDDFPNTVDAAKRIINFPLQNYYTKKDIEKMIRIIKKTLGNL